MDHRVQRGRWPNAMMTTHSQDKRQRSNIEVVMIVRDEELNLTHTLPTITSWADRVWVVDSGSKDSTVEVARAAG